MPTKPEQSPNNNIDPPFNTVGSALAITLWIPFYTLTTLLRDTSPQNENDFMIYSPQAILGVYDFDLSAL